MERAENLARILDISETYARSDRTGPDWKRVLVLNGDTERFHETHGKITPNAVITFYIFDHQNPTSISSSINIARENGRSIRHLISTEMWTHINILHADIGRMRKRSISPNNLSEAARKIILECQTFEGVAEGTFFRGEPWCFYHLGKYIERADQTTRILDIGYDNLSPAEGDAVSWVNWNVLLRSVSGYHAFSSKHPGRADPHDIAVFMLYDRDFPRAVALCCDNITLRLKQIEGGQVARIRPGIDKVRGRFVQLLEKGPDESMKSVELHAFIDTLQNVLGDLSDTIAKEYFLTE